MPDTPNNRWIKVDNKKLGNAISTMILNTRLDMSFYGFLGTKINFLENPHIAKTTATMSASEMNIHYNPTYIENLTQKQVNFQVIHSINHLLLNHPERSGIINSNKELVDLSQDMIINNLVKDNFNTVFYENPEDVEYIPEEYDNEQAMEPLFLWLKNEKKKYDNDKSKGGDGTGSKTGEGVSNELKDIFDRLYQQQEQQCDGQNGNGQNGNGQNGDGQNGDGQNGDGQQCDGQNGDGQNGDGQNGEGNQNGNGQNKQPKNSHHGPDTHTNVGDEEHENISYQVKKALIDKLVNEAKSRGLVTGKDEAMLNKLQKQKKDYLKDIKKAIDNTIGRAKKKSFTKPNRRGIEGLKGHKRYSKKVNVLLDTSGSMCGEFKKVLSYVFQKDLELNLIQVDTEVQAAQNIQNMKQLEKTLLKGFGGTRLQPGLDHIINNREMKKYNTVILTDGYTDCLDFTGIKKALIVSTDVKCPIAGDPKSIRQIIIEKDDLYSYDD